MTAGTRWNRHPVQRYKNTTADTLYGAFHQSFHAYLTNPMWLAC